MTDQPAITQAVSQALEISQPVESAVPPEIPKVDEVRQELQSYEYSNPSLTDRPVQPQGAQHEQQVSTTTPHSPYLTNPERMYDDAFLQKVSEFDKASSSLGTIYADPCPSTLFAVLRDMNSSEIALMEEISRDFYGRDLLTDLKGIAGNDTQQLDVLLKGAPLELPGELHPGSLRTIEFKELLQRGDVEKILQFLRDQPLGELNGLKSTFEEYAKSLSPQAAEITSAFISGNRPLAEALYLKGELNSGRIDAQRIAGALEGLNPDKRNLVSELYTERYRRDLHTDVRDSLKGRHEEQKITAEIFEKGVLSDSSRIYLACCGNGVNSADATDLIRLTEDKSQYEMSRIREEILRNYNTNLDAQAAALFKGKEQFMARLSLFGKPDTLEDEYIRRKAIHDFERLRPPKAVESVIKKLAREGRLTDEELEELEKQHKKISEAKEYLSERDEIHFYNILNFFDKKIDRYEAAKKHYFVLMEGIVSVFAAVLAYFMANEMGLSHISGLAGGGAAFTISKFTCRGYFKKSESTEKALENFKERRRKRKRSHVSRKPRR